MKIHQENSQNIPLNIVKQHNGQGPKCFAFSHLSLVSGHLNAFNFWWRSVHASNVYYRLTLGIWLRPINTIIGDYHYAQQYVQPLHECHRNDFEVMPIIRNRFISLNFVPPKSDRHRIEKCLIFFISTHMRGKAYTSFAVVYVGIQLNSFNASLTLLAHLNCLAFVLKTFCCNDICLYLC